MQIYVKVLTHWRRDKLPENFLVTPGLEYIYKFIDSDSRARSHRATLQEH